MTYLDFDTPPTDSDMRALIWQAARPDVTATKDQRALLYLAWAILRLVESR